MTTAEEKLAKEQKQWERTTQLHERYRTAQLALTVLIVTITGAALNALRPQGILGLLLFVPIALSIAHQTCLCMGQRHDAKGSWKFFISTKQLQSATEAIAQAGGGMGDRIKAMNDTWGKTSAEGWKHSENSNWWYGWADWLCLAAAGAFIVCGAVVAWVLPPSK